MSDFPPPYSYGGYPPPPPKKRMPGWGWGLIIGGVFLVVVCCGCGIAIVNTDSFQKGFQDGYNGSTTNQLR